MKKRLDPHVKTAANRIAHDLARSATTALSLRLRARAQELADEGMQPEEIIEAISREAEKVQVRVSTGGNHKPPAEDAGAEKRPEHRCAPARARR